jgi:hypothetical protein
MLNILIKHFKKILTLLIIAALFTTIGYGYEKDQYIKYSIAESTTEAMQNRACEVVVRVGEYDNKPGKRIYLNEVDVRYKDIPTDIKIHSDSHGAYIHEYDINLKEGKALVDALRANGVNAQLQFTDMKSQDLNAAGRIANKSNPYLYVSIHHNYYDSNSNGYFAMYNPNDNQSRIVANRLSNVIANNGIVRQRENQPNTGYIGELNVLNKSTIGVLLELGFFSNGTELKNICSDNYVEYVSNKLADELTKILNEQYR